ncbi:ankyrin repeat domain-containing protein [Flavobacterium pallidum]|uniref:Ankyrin repeat domain-containing protein n=1 Tax=Flavobacterium pallidum TaxID=2172098 RepID=A0A2S1SIR0_9FLAO|nr:ankyrin repeat domain-containing protein [Flavobacterium pallidum]AWI26304.1 ankyrin repeat domain-containing protein [Flavobacterium pallidum]
MKKSIIYLGMALLSLSNVTMASESKTAVKSGFETTTYTGSPLCLAIAKGDFEVVKKFIEYGASVNETSNGMTPLMFAARYNQVEILKLLVEKGADLKAKDANGFTALKYAENSNATAAAEYLKSIAKK